MDNEVPEVITEDGKDNAPLISVKSTEGIIKLTTALIETGIMLAIEILKQRHSND